jgi:hypothetical protein
MNNLTPPGAPKHMSQAELRKQLRDLLEWAKKKEA